MLGRLEPPHLAASPSHTFNEVFLGLWAAACAARQPLAYLMADLDGLAAYRALRGAKAGELTHHVIAVALAEACAPSAWVGRSGVTGVRLLLPDTSLAAACEVADAARQVVRDLRVPTPDPRRPRLTLSVGASAARPILHARPWPVDLLETAEAALLHARAGGMDRVVARGIEASDGEHPRSIHKPRSPLVRRNIHQKTSKNPLS